MIRRHQRYARLAPYVVPERFAEIVRPEFLVAARLEPGISTRYEGWLDLTFVRDGAVALVPYVIVAGTMLLERESSPLVWPDWLPPMREAVAVGIEERVMPWLASLTIARFCSDETTQTFGEDAAAHAVFARARDAGFLGAAPAGRMLAAAAPYVYAMRYARGARIAVSDIDGASGASMLARAGARIDAELGSQARSDLAARWFGIDAFAGVDSAAGYDVAIGTATIPAATVQMRLDTGDDVAVVAPAPPAIAVSFDPADGPVARRFARSAVFDPVQVRRSALAEVPIVGGSSGRIGIVVRDDCMRAPDADTDAALALRDRLNAQGFQATVVPASDAAAERHDLLHAIGHRFGATFVPAWQNARQARIPLVVSPYIDDAAGEAAWGAAAVQFNVRHAPDRASRAYYGNAIELRKLEGPMLPQRGTPDRATAEARALLGAAHAAVVTSADEATVLRDEFGFTGETRQLAALLGDEPVPQDVRALTGPEQFVFVHAPVDAGHNQLAVAAAAAALDLPLVVCGSVVSAEYYGDLTAELGERAVWIPEEDLTPGQIAGLYAAARVFADCAWAEPCLYRAARAASFGAALVAPTSGFASAVWPGIVQMADPGSPSSIRSALRTAWDKAPTVGPQFRSATAERLDAYAGLKAILALYQSAAKKVVS